MNPNLRQRLGHIQIHGEVIRRQRLREIRQLLAIVHARVTRDRERDHAVLVRVTAGRD